VKKDIVGVGLEWANPLEPGIFWKYRYRTLVKLNFDNLPDYMIITSVKLYLYCTDRGNLAYDQYITHVHRVTEDWTESSLLTKLPTYDTNIEFTLNNGSSGTWHVYNITQFALDVINNAWDNKGLLIRHNYEIFEDNYTSAWLKFAGSEYSNPDLRPYIEIEYTKRAPHPPTNLTPTAVTVQNDSVIRFSWQHDPTLEEPQYKFDLEWRKEGGSWQTISQITENQYYDMPANTLPVGTIYWRVRTYGQNGLVSD